MKMERILAPVLLVSSMAAMICGFAGGLARFGVVSAPLNAADLHGVLMICGFFGTLISLERAVADGRPMAFLVPLLGGVGSVLVLADIRPAAEMIYLAAAIGLFLLTARAALKQPEPFTVLMTVGALALALGDLRWLLGTAPTEVAHLWFGFLILTIFAERLELSRLRNHSSAALGVLALILLVYGTALAVGQPWQYGSRVVGVALAAAALWFVVNDVARITIHQDGLSRFAAVCLLAGYGWLVVAGLGLVLLPPAEAPFGQDLAIHAIGLGFVLSMVMAHAPIILPAVARLPVRYSAWLYVSVVLLQISTALRVVADGLELTDLQPCSAVLTVAAVGSYVILLAQTAVASKRRTSLRSRARAV